MKKGFAALIALLALIIFPIVSGGWGGTSSHVFIATIKVAAAGTTTVYFPPVDSTSYATYLGLHPKYLSVTKVSGSGNDSLFIFGKDMCGDVGRVPMPGNSFTWTIYTLDNLKNGLDSLYIHAVGAGTWLVTMKK